MVVLQLHFLYLSNGNCLSQKEQTKWIGAETAGGGVGATADLVASSAVDALSSLGGCCREWFMGMEKQE